MSRRLLLLLLVAFAAQGVYSQNDEQYVPEDGYENDQEGPLENNDEEGSGAHPLNGFSEIGLDVPLIDETDTATSVTPEDAIQCPVDLCTCSQETEGESIKLTVDCSSKDLTELPAGIDKRVKRLFLQNNRLTELPKDISAFKELEELNVNDNSIKEFAYGSVGELPNLRVLKAANNRLIEFPQELKNGLDLRSLQELDLGGNDMRDTLTGDHFIHMETIKSLTLPVSTRELIEELCHRLGTTLQKVCTNDCSKDIEDCANYAESASDFIPALSSDILDNQAENNNEEENTLKESEGATASEPSIEGDPLPDPASSDDAPLEQPQINVALAEENGDTTEATSDTTIEPLIDFAPSAIITEAGISSDAPSQDIVGTPKFTEFSLRSAVSNGVNVPDSSISLSSGATVLNAPVDVAPPDSSFANVDINNEAAAKIQSAGVLNDNEASKQSGVEAETDQDGGKVGAASVKQGGGIDNSVIALIVAGMVIVVAGVTIKKNWTSIKNRFSSRPSPAAGPAAGQANGTSPEEVPLQDKSMV